ncbi:MAG: hypothetical protein ACREJ5_03475 [Geminicoccaceae bacterium]
MATAARRLPKAGTCHSARDYELAALMIRNNVGVRTRTTYEIKKLDEDYFIE